MKAGDRSDKIAVVVGTITNDIRLLKLPKLKVCSPSWVTPSCQSSAHLSLFSLRVCVCVCVCVCVYVCVCVDMCSSSD